MYDLKRSDLTDSKAVGSEVGHLGNFLLRWSSRSVTEVCCLRTSSDGRAFVQWKLGMPVDNKVRRACTPSKLLSRSNVQESRRSGRQRCMFEIPVSDAVDVLHPSCVTRPTHSTLVPGASDVLSVNASIASNASHRGKGRVVRHAGEAPEACNGSSEGHASYSPLTGTTSLAPVARISSHGSETRYVR